MKHYIRFPRADGTHSRQAHADLPAGTFEREMGKEGFFGPAAHFHHRHPPTVVGKLFGRAQSRTPTTSTCCRRTAIRRGTRRRSCTTATCGSATGKRSRAMDCLVRNQDGDELLFIHDGAGEFFCDWGRLTYRDGDYIVIPRGGMWRIAPSSLTTLLLIECTEGTYTMPEKGIVGTACDLRSRRCSTSRSWTRQFRAQQTDDPWRVVVKRVGALSTIEYPFNPLDAVGWHGDLCVVRINVRDIRPLMSHRFHLPPSAHTTFVGRNFIVCTFVPRPIESDPGALKVPFYHNNDDYDEVIFYHRGEFFSRDNIKPGMVTFHPCGFTHGPHPKAFQIGAAHARKETDEYAVMVDTRFPLAVAPLPEGIENRSYVDSWKAKP